jgi:predicted nucleic acid-binding protein
MIYLLDTNAISDLMRENPLITAGLRAAAGSDRVVTSVIVRGEVFHGLLRMPAGKRKDLLETKAAALFASLPCQGVPESAATHYAQIKSAQQALGLSLDENDLWIAASATAIGSTVVSRDADLRRIHGLKVVDWTAGRPSADS